jgi:hypothetical protein
VVSYRRRRRLFAGGARAPSLVSSAVHRSSGGAIGTGVTPVGIPSRSARWSVASGSSARAQAASERLPAMPLR